MSENNFWRILAKDFYKRCEDRESGCEGCERRLPDGLRGSRELCYIRYIETQLGEPVEFGTNDVRLVFRTKDRTAVKDLPTQRLEEMQKAANESPTDFWGQPWDVTSKSPEAKETQQRSEQMTQDNAGICAGHEGCDFFKQAFSIFPGVMTCVHVNGPGNRTAGSTDTETYCTRLSTKSQAAQQRSSTMATSKEPAVTAPLFKPPTRQLKTCPRCGSKAVLMDKEVRGSIYFYVKCTNGPCSMQTYSHSYKPTPIDNWNWRPFGDQPVVTVSKADFIALAKSNAQHCNICVAKSICRGAMGCDEYILKYFGVTDSGSTEERRTP